MVFIIKVSKDLISFPLLDHSIQQKVYGIDSHADAMGVISFLILMVATGLKVTRWTTIPRRRSFIGFVTLDTTYTIYGFLNFGPW